jgi:hypothetical protein
VLIWPDERIRAAVAVEIAQAAFVDALPLEGDGRFEVSLAVGDVGKRIWFIRRSPVLPL